MVRSARLATVEDVLALDVRVGTIVSAGVLRAAHTPAYALSIDLGPLGKRTAVAEITDLYDSEDLVGLQVAAIVNLPPRQVAGFDAQVLVLTVEDGKGQRALVIPERPVPDGGRVGERG
jgi:tRNA-binding protein